MQSPGRNFTLGKKVRSLSRYQSQSLDDLDTVINQDSEDSLREAKQRPGVEEEKEEASKAVHFPVQEVPKTGVSEAQLDKELATITENSQALASFADQLAPVLIEPVPLMYILLFHVKLQHFGTINTDHEVPFVLNPKP